MLWLTDWSSNTISNRSESRTGGGSGSGLDGNPFKPHKGDSGGSGLKKLEGEDGVKVGSIGVVNVEEFDGPIKRKDACQVYFKARIFLKLTVR